MVVSDVAGAMVVDGAGRTSDPPLQPVRCLPNWCVVTVLTLLLATGLAFTSNAVAATDTPALTAFHAGLAAFKAQQYSRALNEFQRAREAGMLTSALRFNIGVTYYRLERFTEARNEFAALVNEPNRAPVAHYNLGLVALMMGNNDEARSEFEHAYRLTRDPHLESLAQQQLSKLGAQPTEKTRWRGFVDLSAGYDDNVALTSSSNLLATSRTGSAALSLFASGSRQMTGNYRDGFGISGSLYHVEYPSVTAFSQNVLRVAAPYRFRRGLWSGSAGGAGRLPYAGWS